MPKGLNHYSIKRLIAFYENLLKEGRILVGGRAYDRLQHFKSIKKRRRSYH
tara:strand:- start:5429 stop:5581 length:153 start_codon:yes stop_codon:yes gene_type:complete